MSFTALIIADGFGMTAETEGNAIYAETDETVNIKVKKALEKGLIPIVCVGEKSEKRESGVTAEVVCKQTKLALLGVA
ncbi:MAG: triose-phosphate isomerase [Christensenella sp.]